MRRILGSLIFLWILSVAVLGWAQTSKSICPVGSRQAASLYCLPITSTESAYLVPSSGTENFVVQQGFVPVTASIGTQLSTLPTATPASGLIFAFGPGGLTAQRELGPLFSNAPWTLGRHKWYVGFAY